MGYDAAKVEDWVVGLMGFWRKGSVNVGDGIVPFRGTWEQVKTRCDEMRAMSSSHARQREALENKQQQEKQALWSKTTP